MMINNKRKKVIEFVDKPTTSEPIKVIEFVRDVDLECLHYNNTEYSNSSPQIKTPVKEKTNLMQTTTPQPNTPIAPFQIPFYLMPDKNFNIESSNNYAIDKNCYLLLKNNKYIKMTNFIVTNIERYKIHHINKLIEESFSINILDEMNNVYSLRINKADWRNLFAIIEKEFPHLLIDKVNMAKANEQFQNLSSFILRSNANDIQIKDIYTFWGWGNPIAPYGNRKFYHGGLEECASDKVLLPYEYDQNKHINILRTAFNIINIDPIPISILFTYGAAAYMDALFTDAGYPLAHSIMLIGASGMLKTSLMRVLFSSFVEDKDKVYSVRGSEPSFNVLHEKCFDDVLVIDDYNKEGSMRELNQKMLIIKNLIRAFSDKTPRTKYGGNDNVKQYAIRGGLIVTGETQMEGEIESGELRYIKLYLSKPIDGKALSLYQSNPYIIKYFFSCFIRFLEKNYINIVAYIKQYFNYFRNKYNKIGRERLIDDCVHLMFAQYWIQQFLKENLVINEPESNNFIVTFELNLIELLKNQNNSLKMQIPCIRYLQEVWQLLGTGKIFLAPDVDSYIQNRNAYIGYIQNDSKNVYDILLMVDHNELYKKVIKSFNDRREYLPISVDEVSKGFKRLGLSKYDKDTCLKRGSYKIPDRPYFLALIKSACERIIFNS